MAAVSSSGLGFTGLATGIDSAKIIEGLTQINRKKIETLTARQTDFSTKQTAVVALQAKLFDLQTKTAALARSAGGAFDGRKGTSSDDTIATVAAGTAAVPGTYSLTVSSLAQAHQHASAGYTDPNAAIRTGTLQLQVGTNPGVTVTIDDRNATLQGLADAVNAAGTDVKASIINDGTSAPYRLLLTSAKSGAANAITVTNNLTGGTGAAIDPAATTLQAAADAAVTLGSGAGAITVHSATNRLTNLIPGVSLNLLKADATKPITVTVANDSEATVSSVKGFVESFNAVQDFIQEQTAFDAESQKGGVLLSTRDVANLSDDLVSALTATIPGLGTNANRLSSVGLSFDNNGKLVLDEAKLNQALSGQSGVTPADLKKLFAMSGTSDNPGVSFLLGTNKTRPSEATPYQVQVTTTATRAAVTGATALAGSITLDATNNTLILKVNGFTSSTITLDPGTYTPATLAAQIQLKANGNAALSGNLVAVDVDPAGMLRFTSQQFGSASKIAFDGGTAVGVAGPLGLAGSETATGVDVAGQFLANGQVEKATGSGQILTGATGNARTDGLQLRVTLPTPGTANVVVNQGLAGRLNQVLDRYLDPTKGRLHGLTDELAASIDDIQETIDKQNALMTAKTEELQSRFIDMETAVNKLKGLQSQLTSLFPVVSNRDR